MVLSKLSGRDFRQLRKAKILKCKTKNFLFVYKFSESCDEKLSYGVTVTKKKLKKAVYRNRLKRLIRESFRKEINKKETAQNYDLKSIKVNVVFIAPDPQKIIDSVKMHDVQNEVSNFLSKINRPSV